MTVKIFNLNQALYEMWEKIFIWTIEIKLKGKCHGHVFEKTITLERANKNTEVPLSANAGWLIITNHRLIKATVYCAFIWYSSMFEKGEANPLVIHLKSKITQMHLKSGRHLYLNNTSCFHSAANIYSHTLTLAQTFRLQCLDNLSRET